MYPMILLGVSFLSPSSGLGPSEQTLCLSKVQVRRKEWSLPSWVRIRKKYLPNESSHCCLTLSGGQGLASLTLASKVHAVLGLGQEMERSDLSPSSASIQVPLGLEKLPGISPFPLQSIDLPGGCSCLESKDCVSIKALGSHDPLSLKCLQLQLWK